MWRSVAPGVLMWCGGVVCCMCVEEVARRWSSMARLRGMLGCVSPITEIPGAPPTTHLGNPGRARGGLSRSRSYECTGELCLHLLWASLTEDYSSCMHDLFSILVN